MWRAVFVACFIIGLGTLVFISANRAFGMLLLCVALVAAMLWWAYHQSRSRISPFGSARCLSPGEVGSRDSKSTCGVIRQICCHNQT
jgi:hypothetical protein